MFNIITKQIKVLKTNEAKNELSLNLQKSPQLGFNTVGYHTDGYRLTS